MSETTLRDTFNAADENRTGAAFSDTKLGEVFNRMLLTLAPTEGGLVPAADIITLATTPSALIDINVTAGASTGHKKLLKGSANSAGVILPVPAPGEATWDGSVKVRLNTADAAATVDVKYAATANPTVSYLQRQLGEQD